MQFDKSVNYIKNLLTDGINGANYIHYGMPDESKKPLIIVPADFFANKLYGTAELMPAIPLIKLEQNVPILFGSDQVVRKEKQIIIYADLIASSFYLLSRYDEKFCKIARDKYGRPLGCQSFKAKAGILDRPLVDEYREFIVTELQNLGYDIKISRKLRHVYLTHDVDHPWIQYGKIHAVKAVIKNFVMSNKLDIVPILNSMGIYKWNHCDTFDWLFQQDEKVKKVYEKDADDIYFFIGVNYQTDMTMKYWDNKRVKKYVEKIKKHASKCGVHASYEAGEDGVLFKTEKKNVEFMLNGSVCYNRNHYLMSNSVDWLQYLVSQSITDDFTMGYADVLGFRLGTCRTVRWIDPASGNIYDLRLHPLSVMDSTLMESQYMGLKKAEAILLVKKMIDISVQYGGDFTILLHNDTPSSFIYSWWKDGYEEVVEYLCQLRNDESV